MVNDNLGGEKAIIEERRKKLEQLREKGDAYSNSFKPKNNAKALLEEYGDFTKDELAEKNIKNILLKKTPVCILVGPEGDFSENERQLIVDNKKTISICLARNILRSETAAISASIILDQHLNP